MDRVQINTPATVTNTWYENGSIVDPGTVTLGIDRADGTELVAAGTATSGTGAAARTFSLTTSHTSLLDCLTVTWTSATKGTMVTYVEVVGGFLFSVADARALTPLDSTAAYTTAAIVAMRTTVEQALEHACSAAFVPRYTRETFTGHGAALLLSRPYVTAIRDVTISGTALTSTDLAGLSFSAYGGVSGYTWPTGYGSIIVGFEHGRPFPPPEVSRAALILTKLWLTGQNRPIDDRAITFNTTEGGTYSLAVPGRNGSVFGHPDVDSVVQRYSLNVGVA